MSESLDDPPDRTIHVALRQAAADKPVAELAKIVLAMREGDPGEQEEDTARDRGAVNSALIVKTAAECRTPDEVAGLVAEFDARGAHDLGRLTLHTAAVTRTPRYLALLACELAKLQFWATVNCAVIAEIAAECRTPDEVAGLVAEFDARGAHDLGWLTLDAAAVTRTPQELSALVRELAEVEVPGAADLLLAAVVRRRLPRGIAELLGNLSTGGLHGPAGTLIDKLSRDEGRLLVILWLRAEGLDDLAGQAAERTARELAPAELAGFIRALRANKDAASADAAISGALGRDPRALAEMIASLRGDPVRQSAAPPGTSGVSGMSDALGVTVAPGETAVADDGDAADLIREVLGNWPVPDLCVLASQLSSGPWREDGQLVWQAVMGQTAGADAFVKNVSAAMRGSGDPAGALVGVRQAALDYPVEDVALLATEVDGKIEAEVDGERRRGYDTVLDTVAAHRSVTDIFAVADKVSGHGYRRVADDLLRRVEGVVHQGRDGAEIAEFIEGTLARGDGKPQPRRPFGPKHQRWQPQPEQVLRNVARAKDPRLMMDVIRGLSQRGKYDACRAWTERAVCDHYNVPLLVALPLVLRRGQLPQLLQIFVRLVQNPSWTPPQAFPSIVRALSDAGATESERRQLLTFTGHTRFDYQDISEALRREADRKAGPGADPDYTEANWVNWGHRNRRAAPDFLAYKPSLPT
jgi:hypothetical protein